MIETLNPPTTERVHQLSDQGFTIDQSGRPLHPWISERNIGLPEQSPLWQWGPNAAADAIVFNTEQPQVLLIKRLDGTWANAGGFIDPADVSKAHAAAREAHEEEGVILDPAEALPVFEGIVNDTRASKYSWVTTAAFLWRTGIRLDQLTASDDAQDIRLADLATVRREKLSGSHNQLIESAINQHGTLTEKLHYYANDSETLAATGGHMGYHRTIATLPTGEQIFTKQFAPDLYTDDARATHSLLYLQKEQMAYDHLSKNDYQHTPERTEYHAGTLAMNALTSEHGWTWQHPTSEPALRDYIVSALNAAQDLSALPVMEDASAIMSSHVSFFNEGWGMYDYDSKQKLSTKLYEYAATVTDSDCADSAYRLVDELDALYQAVWHIDNAQPVVMCHHDFRQSNIAYNPEQGAKIVDWSWAGPGFKNADTTTLLIDLHKRSVNVSEYMEHFNQDHALMMIGFWLMHSTWPAYGTSDVRFQQVHSAVAAYDLLNALK